MAKRELTVLEILKQAGGKLKNKYRAQPVTVDGRRFASKREAARYGQLVLFQRAGKIHSLLCQPPFAITVKGVKVATYYADFSYVDTATGQTVIEDAKSPATRTAVYRLKKKLVEVLHGIKVVEV